MQTQAERLKAARQHAGYDTAADAARAFGWPIPTYRAHEGDTRGLKHAVAESYARAFRVSAEWIIFGRNPPKWLGAATAQAQRVPMRVLPEIAWHDVGRYIAGGGNAAMTLAERDIEASDRIGARAFWLRVADDAMASTLGRSVERGALIAIDPDAVCNPGDLVLALPDGADLPVVRRLQLRSRPGEPAAYDLRPSNTDHPTLPVTTAGGGAVLGRVVAMQQLKI